LRVPAKHIVQSLCIAAAVAALTAAIVYMVSYLIYPVTGIEVRGAHMFPESEASDFVPDRASLLTLNSTMLESKIKADPWVESVEVRKVWDSGIVAVEVKERKAVLNAEVNGEREIFAADGTELPGLGGASLEQVELDENQLEGILRAGRVLESNGVSLESVDGAGAGGFRGTVRGRTVIFTGGLGEAQAKALPGIMSENPKARRFELRNDGRVVVGRLQSSRKSGSESGGIG